MNSPPGRPPQTKNEWGILVILSFFFVLFLALELASRFTVAKLSVPFFFLSWALLLAIHELGHAAAAKLLGWKVEMISIGLGRTIASFALKGCQVEVRILPLAGFVVPRPRSLHFPRFKYFLIFAAGPGVELLLVALLVLAFGFDDLLVRSESISLIAVQSFCVAALWGALCNLIPFPHRSEEGTSWSDGLGMILCWRLPDEWFEERKKGSPPPGADQAPAFACL